MTDKFETHTHTKDPQKKHRLGKVSKKITKELKHDVGSGLRLYDGSDVKL